MFYYLWIWLVVSGLFAEEKNNGRMSSNKFLDNSVIQSGAQTLQIPLVLSRRKFIVGTSLRTSFSEC